MNIKGIVSDIAGHLKEVEKATELYKENKISRREYEQTINTARIATDIGRNNLNFELSLIKEKLDKLKELEREDIDD